MRRVAITGVGPVSSIGVGKDAFLAGLREGRSGISRIASFDVSGFPNTRAGEVRDFEPTEILQRLNPAAWGRSSLFAAAAGRLAVNDAGLVPDDAPPERVAVVMGTTCGESSVIEALTAEIVERGYEFMSPDLLAQSPAGRIADGVCEELAATGGSTTLATACSASNYAIGYAYDNVAEGDVDVVVAGGADSVCRWVHAGFYRLGALAREDCAPFDRDRQGLLTAEGGSAVVLEELDHARQRGARVYAEVLGYGSNCDAEHIVAPSASSIAACMQLAHRNSHVQPGDIDYVCAHGTGTPSNDLAETRAMQEVFGERVPVTSSIKSMLGHTMGAASGFGAIASALAIHEGFVPPTTHWKTPDPTLGNLEPVPNQARSASVRVVQNNGFAFGGNNAIVIFGACS